MDALFAKAALSFMVGGAWITLAMLMAERLGSKAGGILIALPSTTLVSMLFIGWLEGAEYAAQTASLEPFGLMAAGVLIFCSVALLEKYGNKAFLMAIAAWLATAIAIKAAGWGNMAAGAVLYSALALFLYYVLDRKMGVASVKVKAGKYTASALLSKACIAGGAVAATVIVAALAGPFWGGVFATLPAATLSAMYMLNREHGAAFAMATGKAVLPGSLSMVVFVVGVSLTYPAYGIVQGTVISYAAAAAFAVLMYFLMKK
jgi:hypothetical protein